MNKEELLTIQEFADRVGITPQAVYKRLDKDDLKPFVQIIDNKKYISPDALNLFKNVNETVDKPGLETEVIELLKSQISSLLDEVQQLRDINQQLTNSLMDLSAQYAQLTAAQLLIINKPKKSLLPWKRKKEER